MRALTFVPFSYNYAVVIWVGFFLIELYARQSMGFVLYNVSDLMSHHFMDKDKSAGGSSRVLSCTS